MRKIAGSGDWERAIFLQPEKFSNDVLDANDMQIATNHRCVLTKRDIEHASVGLTHARPITVLGLLGQLELEAATRGLDHLLGIEMEQSLRVLSVDLQDVVALLHTTTRGLAAGGHLGRGERG